MARTQTSLRKIKSLVFLMVLTLILGLTATYAWFSTQRDIEVSGMRLNVEVAESLQISLDGEIWTQSIQIANMRQFYGTYTGTGDSFAIYQAKKPDAGGNTNYVPTELLPVSSAGEVSNGKLQFVQGTIENNADGTTKLKGITACSENDLIPTETVANRQNGNAQHPYLVFDMYLRNISAKTTGLDELLLNAGSAVWVNSGTADDGDQEGVGVAGTGLEYSARVGMVVYGNTISTTATNTQTKTIGQQIRELTADGNEVAAIWEPNNKEHTAYVVANNGRGITATSQEVDTYGVKVAVASAATKEIANINATNDANLVAVDTFTPDYTTAEGGVDKKTIITNTAGNNLGIAPNQISKVRIYVWLEGQDPDCIDLASTGDKLNVTLKLTKDQTTTTDKNTYVGEGSGSGNTTTLASVTNEDNIGDYIDLGNSIVGTTATTDDWRILYKEENTIYAILADYLPNSTKYAENAGLQTSNTYSVYSTTNRDTLLTRLTTTSNWSGLTNGITGATATGSPTAELLINSYNEKSGESLTYEDYPTLTSTIQDYDLYVPHTGEADNCYGYWLASHDEMYSDDVWFVDIDGEVGNNNYGSTDHGLRPVVSLPSDIPVTKDGDTWVVQN